MSVSSECSTTILICALQAHDDQGNRLAVARENGDIQIWSTLPPRWHPLGTCVGSESSKIRSVCWAWKGAGKLLFCILC